MQTTFLTGLGRSASFTATAAIAAGLVACASVPTESADAVLQRANTAMGGSALRSISFAGSGAGATFGQAYHPGMAWPKITYSSFSRVADYDNAAFREDAARSRAEAQGGGAVPLMGTGEQRTSGLLRGSSAWNIAGPAPTAAHWRWTGAFMTCGPRRTVSSRPPSRTSPRSPCVPKADAACLRCRLPCLAVSRPRP